MSKKERKKVSYVDARDRFQQISEKRAIRLIKQADNILNMLDQSSYEIAQEDALKLSTVIKEHIDPLIGKLDGIAEFGREVKQKKEKEEVKIF